MGEGAGCGRGPPADGPRARDCLTPRVLARKLTALRDRLAGEVGTLDAPAVADVCAAYRAFAERVALADEGFLSRVRGQGQRAVVFEGAQGVLRDEWHGFHPYPTWSTTTLACAETLLAEARLAGAEATATRIGVTRCYQTRHGPGPFVTEDPRLELPEPHNEPGAWQRAVRTRHPGAVPLRYGLEVGRR